MVANITFLSFLLFSMCQSIQVVVNTWLNCSFFTLIAVMSADALHDVNNDSYMSQKDTQQQQQQQQQDS